MKDGEQEEHPEIVKADVAATKALEARRKSRPRHVPGWWRGDPNPHSVGHEVDDDEL